MLILAGTIRIATGKREPALAAMRDMVAATRAEPGCVQYRFAFDIHDECVVHIFEVFRDEAALVAHRASPHMARWRALGPDLGVSDRDMVQYEIGSWKQI